MIRFKPPQSRLTVCVWWSWLCYSFASRDSRSDRSFITILIFDVPVLGVTHSLVKRRVASRNLWCPQEPYLCYTIIVHGGNKIRVVGHLEKCRSDVFLCLMTAWHVHRFTNKYWFFKGICRVKILKEKKCLCSSIKHLYSLIQMHLKVLNINSH